MTSPCLMHETAIKASALGQPRGMGWDGKGGGRGVQDWRGGGDTCTPVADSCKCMAKASTIL